MHFTCRRDRFQIRLLLFLILIAGCHCSAGSHARQQCEIADLVLPRTGQTSEIASSLLQASSHRVTLEETREDQQQSIFYNSMSSSFQGPRIRFQKSTRFQGASILILIVVPIIFVFVVLAWMMCLKNAYTPDEPEAGDASKSTSEIPLKDLRKAVILKGELFSDVQNMSREELEAYLVRVSPSGSLEIPHLSTGSLPDSCAMEDEVSAYDDSSQLPGALWEGDAGCDPQERDEYDPEAIPEHIQKTYSSWKLLAQISAVLAEFWTALAFMYWSLLYKDEELMDCNDYGRDQPYSIFVRHSCYYTLACLRGFPILAANVILVLMIRILVQARLYYCMLKDGYVLDFAGNPVMQTIWPYLCGFSMLQGGLHFVLQAYFLPEKISKFHIYMQLVRKFVLPGLIFFRIVVRYVDIENTLVPLNRIVELDYTKDSTSCPWLANVRAVNELVLAYDTRHRDVIGDTLAQVGKAPTMDDVVRNMIKGYQKAHKRFARQVHHNWGLFRSMWVASVLLDTRLDKDDPDTRSWLMVFAVLATGSILTSLLSFYLLFQCTSNTAWRGFTHMVASMWEGGLSSADTETVLANVVLVLHAIMIIVFIHHAIRSMFYWSIQHEVDVMRKSTESFSRKGTF